VRVALFDYQYMDLSDGEAPAMIVLTCAVSILDDPLPRMIIRGHRLGGAQAALRSEDRPTGR